MRIRLIALLILLTTITIAQTREKAFEINQELGRGINFGNMFEAPSETAWGNQWQPEYSKMIADLGFQHVRIPIRWEPEDRSSSADPYTINTIFLERIKQVVDSALNNNLYAIINMHHHEELYENPDEQKARFLAQWQQISAYFADYPNQLVFEILNEPHGNLSAEKWNIMLAEALDTIRINNPERIVLIGTAEYGGLGGLSKLQLPDDENIILTVHYYNPFSFTHQGASWADGSDEWLGTEWTDTETERQVIQNDFASLKTFEETNNIPIHIGEFGAYSTADINSREKWTTYLARYFESLNWSWAYWEFCAGFGIYNKDNQTYKTELVDALLHNTIPEPANYVGTPVYSSDFASTISDWGLYTNGGASASESQTNNLLAISITQIGTENWHIQLVKNNIQLQAGKKYRLSFKVKANSTRAITSYIGQSSSPWSIYSGYQGVELSDTFSVISYVFDMNTTDSSARIVFDLGQTTSDVYFEYILLEEVVLQVATSVNTIEKFDSKIYPNPLENILNVDNLDNFQELTIVDIDGQLMKQIQLSPYKNATRLSKLPSSIYFATLSNANKKHTIKIQKN